MSVMSQNPRFSKVLVANRGEIAVRIIGALRELGLTSVAVYSDADKDSQHRFLADQAVRLPGTTSAETYLDIAKILDAMQRSGASALHPGYGFLSENAEFVERVTSKGWHFIGPSAKAMATMGDKVAAKKLMKEVGVPVVPGSEAPLEDSHQIMTIAKELGFPLILKAAAGGGGRGMRIVHQEAELEAALSACQREAQLYFANPAVFCERYIENPRHIEFQVLCDEKGKGIHLYERDCSVQRRHQKLLEEAPSTYLDEKQREKLGELALKAAKAVNYCGAGTVEFICASPTEVYFMEMNTRIQVEHPVTECITGVDLVQEQIKIALGMPLSYQQQDIQIRGWSIEARINAEDAKLDFAASPGTIKELNFPTNPFVRIDSHIYSGYTIPSEYDSMIAKVIAWAPDRNAAIRKLLVALSELKIEGIPTTTNFQEAVLSSKEFCQGNIDTGFVSRFLENNPNWDHVDAATGTLETNVMASYIVEQIQRTSRPPSVTKDNRSRWQHTNRLRQIGN